MLHYEMAIAYGGRGKMLWFDCEISPYTDVYLNILPQVRVGLGVMPN